MSDQLKKPIQEGANSAAASNEPPSSPTRKVNSSKQSVHVHEEAMKPFLNLDNVDKKGDTDSPEDDVEDKGGTPPIPVPVQDANASSALVAGTNTWSPEMGIENFCFSHGREWKLSEFVGPKWSLSQVLVPNTFQRNSIPFLRE